MRRGPDLEPTSAPGEARDEQKFIREHKESLYLGPEWLYRPTRHLSPFSSVILDIDDFNCD